MKKTLTLISAMIVIAGVMATSSVAKNSNHGNQGSSRAQIFRATLAPVVAPLPTGATGGVTAATGATGAVPAVQAGRVHWVQNKKRYNGYIKVRGLTPATTYTAGVYENVDTLGCASTTNTPLDPPALGPLVTDVYGNAKRNLHGKLSAFKFDTTKSYYVRVNDAAGATVLCGELKAKKSKKAKSKSNKGKHKGSSKSKGHS